DDGDVDLHELAALRLVLVLTFFVHFEADRGVPGQRGVELGVVGEDLAEETWLVGPHDTLPGVVDLHAHDLRHDDRTQVELKKQLPRVRGLWLREVGRRQVVDRLRPDEVRRRAPLPVEQVLLEGMGDDETEGRGDQPDDDQAEYPELARQRNVPPPPDQPRHGWDSSQTCAPESNGLAVGQPPTRRKRRFPNAGKRDARSDIMSDTHGNSLGWK